MGTRAASATFSLRAKQKLVKLLFGNRDNNHQPGRSNTVLYQTTKACPKLLDHASYSYQDLKNAYYERIQQLHPDKQHSLPMDQEKPHDNKEQQMAATTSKRSKAAQFMELQQAWRDYEEYAKMMKRVGEADADFTLFGVGCSFSDSEVEREQRSKIMDEASRGWFSAGALASSENQDPKNTNANNKANSSTQTRLLCDDMFEQHDDLNEKSTIDEPVQARRSEQALKSSLIAHLIPPHKRHQTNLSKRDFSTSSSSHVYDVLLRVKSQELSPEQAVKYFETSSRIDDKEVLQRFANLDYDRISRTGFPEAVFAESKTPLQVAQILDDMARNANTAPNFSGQAILATRVSQQMYEELSLYQFQHGSIVYHHEARIVAMTPSNLSSSESSRALAIEKRVVVVTAGTTDIPVAEEAAVTLEAANVGVDRVYDAGVAGLHRILRALPVLKHEQVACILVIAGMDGALPSVVGGLVQVPVVAIPTSIGYGASFSGISALLTMLNSCSPGVGVVNIDNGFGGAALAYKMLIS